jgi:hypothetical protein
MLIEGIVISCQRFDLHLTRPCVASIRFWYPDIPIWLLKDRQHGEFNTSEIERYWKVKVYPSQHKKLGWGFGKLDVVTEPSGRRLMLLDSDTVFTGRVIDRLQQFGEELVVDREDFSPEAIGVQFFPVDKLLQLDPQFAFPGYGFNTGQFVVTTGRIVKADFDGLLDWEDRSVKHPDVFQKGEQGVFNYVVLRKVQQRQLTLHREPFMVWPGEFSRARHIRVQDLTLNAPHAEVIHWAGLGWGRPLEEMPRSEILLHFENLYYARIPSGGWIRHRRRVNYWAKRTVLTPFRRLVSTLRSRS